MVDFASKAESYRTRAVELRAIADSMSVKEAKDILAEIADDYDKMAGQVDRLVRDGLFPRNNR